MTVVADSITIDPVVFAGIVTVILTGIITFLAWIVRELNRATTNNTLAAAQIAELAGAVHDLKREVRDIRSAVWSGTQPTRRHVHD